MSLVQYKRVFSGGTFDNLHKGHQSLLSAAFEVGETVAIGVTSDRFVQKYKQFPETIRAYTERRKMLELWLWEKNYQNRATIIPIDDPLDPAAKDPYDAIMVTAENVSRGNAINKLRVARGLPPLALVRVQLVNAVDGVPISSTRVRSGEIRIDGTVVMPPEMRTILARPMGPLWPKDVIPEKLQEFAKRQVVTVGDMTTHTVLKAGITPILSIIDLHVGREPFQELAEYDFPKHATVMHITSGPGFISREAMSVISSWGESFREGASMQYQVIVVKGEEDLLTLPVVIYAPVGSIVLYGQPPMVSWENNRSAEGLVAVEVNEHTRERAIDLLGRFTIK